MTKPIYAYNYLLSHRLKHGQALQLLENIKNNSGALINTIPELVQYFATFNTKLVAFDTYFRKNQALFKTDAVANLDGKRRFLTRALTAKVAYHAAFPMTEEEKEDIKTLAFILNTYKHSETREYEDETSFVRNLIAELRNYAALLTKFMLTEIVDNLDTVNNDFETVYNERTQERFEQKEHGDMLRLRKEAVSAFDLLAQAIIGRMLMPTTDAVKATLNSIVGIINANIEQFEIIYHRHAGISGKKNNETGNGEENAETQTPDISPPKAPGMPDQNPSGGPHHLDPNEHPAAGE
jgi:hypothetical protein